MLGLAASPIQYVLNKWHLGGFHKVLLFCGFTLGQTLTIKRDADEARARPGCHLGSNL